MLEQMFQVSRAVKRPIAMFVDQSDTASIQASVDAGVSAYIVGGLQEGAHQDDPRSVHLALQRFLAPAERTRPDQERARGPQGDRSRQGHSDEAKNITEEDAYALLRKTAMNENKKIAEVAQSVITAAEMFK